MLEPKLLARIARLELHDSLPSTNHRLLQAPAPDSGLAVCLADHQTAGKGRDGKKWYAPRGAGLLLSMSRVATQPPDSSLSLALGVAIAEALEGFVTEKVDLKWPNDLIANDGKLGGILVESTSRQGTDTLTVAGLGVNIQVTEEQLEQVAADGGMPPVGLAELPAKGKLERHALAAAVISAMAEVLERHAEEGFASWQEAWQRRDWLSGRHIEALCGNEACHGVAVGVDPSGALLLKAPGGTRRILSAEIRL